MIQSKAVLWIALLTLAMAGAVCAGCVSAWSSPVGPSSDSVESLDGGAPFGHRFGSSAYPFAYPVGDAGGDLCSAYPTPTVCGMLGKPLPALDAGYAHYNGTAWVFDTPAGAVPSGTGFAHVTSGSLDSAARAVNIASSDVTGTLPIGNGGTGLTSLGSDDQLLGVNHAGSSLSYFTLGGAGTIASGNLSLTLNAPSFLSGALGVANGGTGDSTLTAHNLLLGEGSSVGFEAPGASGTVLVSQGSSSDPSFSTITNSSLSAGTFSNITGVGTLTAGSTGSGFTLNLTLPTISGTLGVANGGTGATTLTAHSVLLGEGTSTFGFAGPSATSGLPLLSSGSSADPTFGTLSLSALAQSGASTGQVPVWGGSSWAPGAVNLSGVGVTGVLPVINQAPQYVFVFQPGGVAGGNVYTTWSSLMTAVGNVIGAKIIVVDGTFSVPQVPSGTWNVDQVTFRPSKLYTFGTSSTQNVLELLAGAALTFNSLYLDGPVVLDQVSTSSIPMMITTNQAYIQLTNSAALICGTGVQPMISVQTSLVTGILTGGASIGGTSTCVTVSTSDTLNLGILGPSSLTSNIIGGTGTLILAVDNNVLTSTTTQATSTVTTSVLGQAAYTNYSPTTPSNWSPSPTLVNAALDQLAARTISGLSPSSVSGTGLWTSASGSLNTSASLGTPFQVPIVNSGGTNFAWGTLTNSSLTVGAFPNITGVGTMTSGSLGSGFTLNLALPTISGTLPVANGGTGSSTLSAHNVLLGEGTSALGTAAPGAAGTVLVSQGSSADPSFSTITNSSLAAGTFSNVTGVGTLTAGATGSGFTLSLGSSTVSGTLFPVNGGTGVSSPSANGVAVANGSSAFNFESGSAAGQVLAWNSSGPPTFQALAFSSITGTLSLSQLPSCSAAGQILVENSGVTALVCVSPSGALSLTAAGVATINLGSGSTVTGTLPVGNGGTGATTLAANGVLYGNGTSAVQVTSAPSAAGQLLEWNGTAWQPYTPSWHLQSFTSTGTSTYTTQATQTYAVVCGCGSGAGGAGGISGSESGPPTGQTFPNGPNGGGGGGGAPYSCVPLTLTVSTTYDATVHAGGIGGGPAANGSPGVASTFTTTSGGFLATFPGASAGVASALNTATNSSWLFGLGGAPTTSDTSSSFAPQSTIFLPSMAPGQGGEGGGASNMLAPGGGASLFAVTAQGGLEQSACFSTAGQCPGGQGGTTGTSNTYSGGYGGGGGGGGGAGPGSLGGSGGSGGSGNGSATSGGNGFSASANTCAGGGGGGGGGSANSPGTPGAGGSGGNGGSGILNVWGWYRSLLGVDAHNDNARPMKPWAETRAVANF